MQSKNGTEFTSGIGLAATWNPSLMAEIGNVLGKEHRSRGFNLMVAPRLYLTTDPRTGRTEEGYGEDPLLATPFVEGLQKNGVISVICLFPTEFGSGGRLCERLEISERDLRERYMYPFEQAVKVGKAAGIMPAYGAVNGIPVHGNPWLLDTILRKEWGFDGIVFNDYNANASFSGRLGIPDPTVKFVQARTNVEFPLLGTYDHKLDEVVKKGRSSRRTKGGLSLEIGGLNIIQAKPSAKIAGKINNPNQMKRIILIADFNAGRFVISNRSTKPAIL